MPYMNNFFHTEDIFLVKKTSLNHRYSKIFVFFKKQLGKKYK